MKFEPAQESRRLSYSSPFTPPKQHLEVENLRSLMIVPDYFATDPDWAAYASKHGYQLPPNKATDNPPPEQLDAHTWDFGAIRAGLADTEGKWDSKHLLSTRGYESTLTNIQVRDSSYCSVKISWPGRERMRRNSSDSALTLLPVMFVTHGGGWIQGTHTTEEAWLLWPLYKNFDLVIVSVEYRLAPGPRFPTWIEDSWDVLQKLVSDTSLFLPTDCAVNIDQKALYLAGSSAGGGISAVLSQMCRDIGIRVSGVILNVPVLCDYRDVPTIPPGGRMRPSSYEQCIGTFSDARAMMALWDMIHTSTDSRRDLLASPLLDDLVDLPPHIIFVAGQDPLRDEGIAYARKQQEQSISARLQVYPGVPHNFAQFWELKATQQFWQDLIAGLNVLLNKVVVP